MKMDTSNLFRPDITLSESDRRQIEEIKQEHGAAIRAACGAVVADLRGRLGKLDTADAKAGAVYDAVSGIGQQLNMRIDSGGTDAGARNRRAIMDILKEVFEK